MRSLTPVFSAGSARLERATSGSGDQRSIQTELRALNERENVPFCLVRSESQAPRQASLETRYAVRVFNHHILIPATLRAANPIRIWRFMNARSVHAASHQAKRVIRTPGQCLQDSRASEQQRQTQKPLRWAARFCRSDFDNPWNRSESEADTPDATPTESTARPTAVHEALIRK